MRKVGVTLFFLFSVYVSLFALEIISNPPESLVYVNGVLVGQTNTQGELIVNVKNGSKIEVESIGYLPYTFICSSCNSTVHVDLSPISYLSLSATPQGAQAIVDGSSYSLPATIVLGSGRHTVTVEKDGYISQKVFVSTQPFRVVRREFTLQRSGKVTIRSLPKAFVKIDGEDVGMTPFSTYLQTGEHSVIVGASGYSTVSTTLSISPDSSPIDITFRLKKLFEVSICSSPSNAIVTIASTTFIAPATLELVAGTYTYSASQIYSFPARGKITISKSGRYILHLKMRTGMVVFTSNPLGAAVDLDGKFVGQTQKSMKLSYGPHKVRMVGPDGGIWFGNFILDRQIRTVYGDMINSGMVLINSEPSSGTMVHMGQIWTTVPATLNAAVGVYRIEFFNPKFPTLYRYIEVKAGKVTNVNVSLEPMSTFFMITKPLGAKVSLDGRVIGISPLFSVDVKAGEHLLSVEWPDGKLEKKMFFMKDQIYTFDFADPNSVKVEFVSYPDPLKLEIDGEVKGYTPISIQLTRGTHTYVAYDILGNEVESGTLDTTYLSSKTYFFLNAVQ